MRKLFASLAVAAGAVAFADEPKKIEAQKPDTTAKKDEPASRKDQFAELTKTMVKERSELVKEINAAKDEERTKLIMKYQSMGPGYALKALKIAEEDPKDDVGFDAAFFAFQNGGVGTTGKKAISLLVENHPNNPKLATMVESLGANDAGLAALKTLSEKSTDKAIKGLSLFTIAANTIENADYPRTGEPISPEKQAIAFKKGEDMLAKLGKEYGDVKTRRGTIAKGVEDQLYFINNLVVGKTLPDGEATDLDGKKVKMSDYRGKVVVLDIWATWCGPCKAMIPHERELVKKMADKPFTFISLSADEKKETLTSFIEKEPMPWTHWWNGGARGGLVEQYKIRFYPTIYVMDGKGVIRFKHVRGEKMDNAVESLLKEGAN